MGEKFILGKYITEIGYFFTQKVTEKKFFD